MFGAAHILAHDHLLFLPPSTGPEFEAWKLWLYSCRSACAYLLLWPHSVNEPGVAVLLEPEQGSPRGDSPPPKRNGEGGGANNLPRMSYTPRHLFGLVKAAVELGSFGIRVSGSDRGRF